MNGPSSGSVGVPETGPSPPRIPVVLLALSLGLCGAVASPGPPPSESPGMAARPADPELLEWAGSTDARRAEFKWSLDSSAGYEAVRDALVHTLGIKKKLKPRYRTVEFLDQHGILAEQSRLLRVRRTFSDDSFATLRSADVTLKVRGEDEAGVRSQVESLWRSAGRKKGPGGQVPWCLAKGRSCKLEWDKAAGGSSWLAFSMKRDADDEGQVQARVARVAALAGASQPKPVCQQRAHELSWSAKVEMEGEAPGEIVVDFAWWYQEAGQTHAMEVSVETDDVAVVDFVSRRVAHLVASRPTSKTLRYLADCRS